MDSTVRFRKYHLVSGKTSKEDTHLIGEQNYKNYRRIKLVI